jgi:hypothetical protein
MERDGAVLGVTSGEPVQELPGKGPQAACGNTNVGS